MKENGQQNEQDFPDVNHPERVKPDGSKVIKHTHKKPKKQKEPKIKYVGTVRKSYKPKDKEK